MKNNLINRSLITAARISIDKDAGTAKKGALRTEESLPEQTILHTVFFYSKSRGSQEMSSRDVQKKVENKVVGKYAMFGGHETIGRGITKIIKVI
jgi:CRISPR-associated protein Cmr4